MNCFTFNFYFIFLFYTHLFIKHILSTFILFYMNFLKIFFSLFEFFHVNVIKIFQHVNFLFFFFFFLLSCFNGWVKIFFCCRSCMNKHVITFILFGVFMKIKSEIKLLPTCRRHTLNSWKRTFCIYDIKMIHLYKNTVVVNCMVLKMNFLNKLILIYFIYWNFLNSVSLCRK